MRARVFRGKNVYGEVVLKCEDRLECDVIVRFLRTCGINVSLGYENE